MFKRLRGAFHTGAKSSASSDEPAQSVELADAPVVWLLGKVQSGKTSTVRAITGSSDAEIGNGFRPCTRSSRIFDFPQDAPVLRFLDTRGLGEAGYDPEEDLQFSEQSAHVLLVTMRAMDPQQEAIVAIVRKVRERNANWPVVVVQTALHEAYKPGAGHISPYPFTAQGTQSGDVAGIPQDLLRALNYQRSLFSNIKGKNPVIFVPVDFTRAEDGFEPKDYGLEALTGALEEVAPAGLFAMLEAMPGVAGDPDAARANPIIMGHAMAAAGGDLVPLPIAGMIAASTVQAKLLHRLGSIYGITWDKRAYADLSAALGAGTLIKAASQVGLRQLVKFIPAYGQTAGAAMSAVASFSLTYALGKAASYYLHKRRQGKTDREGIAAVYQRAMREAFQIARQRRSDTVTTEQTA